MGAIEEEKGGDFGQFTGGGEPRRDLVGAAGKG